MHRIGAMVGSRAETRRRRRDNSPLDSNPKRTKVHAQRKFAQGASALGSTASTPAKEKSEKSHNNDAGVNGSNPNNSNHIVNTVVSVPKRSPPTRGFKKPSIDDMITFFTYRSTPVLPPQLEHLNKAPSPDPAADVVLHLGETSKSKLCEKNNRDLDKQISSKQPVKTASSQQFKAVSAAQALKKKYQEQRLKKTSVASLSHKVKGNPMMRSTRSTGLITISPKTQILKKGSADKKSASISIKKKPDSSAKTENTSKKSKNSTSNKQPLANKSNVLSISGSRSRGGLRSSGIKLESSLRSGAKKASPILSKSKKKKPAVSDQTKKSSSKKGKVTAASLSDFSSEDDQPLLKKSKSLGQAQKLIKKSIASFGRKMKFEPRRSLRGSAVSTPSLKVKSASGSHQAAPNSRPSRKTKEAATLFMEILGHSRSTAQKASNEDKSKKNRSLSNGTKTAAKTPVRKMKKGYVMELVSPSSQEESDQSPEPRSRRGSRDIRDLTTDDAVRKNSSAADNKKKAEAIKAEALKKLEPSKKATNVGSTARSTVSRGSTDANIQPAIKTPPDLRIPSSIKRPLAAVGITSPMAMAAVSAVTTTLKNSQVSKGDEKKLKNAKQDTKEKLPNNRDVKDEPKENVSKGKGSKLSQDKTKPNDDGASKGKNNNDSKKNDKSKSTQSKKNKNDVSGDDDPPAGKSVKKSEKVNNNKQIKEEPSEDESSNESETKSTTRLTRRQSTKPDDKSNSKSKAVTRNIKKAASSDDDNGNDSEVKPTRKSRSSNQANKAEHSSDEENSIKVSRSGKIRKFKSSDNESEEEAKVKQKKEGGKRKDSVNVEKSKGKSVPTRSRSGAKTTDSTEDESDSDNNKSTRQSSRTANNKLKSRSKKDASSNSEEDVSCRTRSNRKSKGKVSSNESEEEDSKQRRSRARKSNRKSLRDVDSEEEEDEDEDYGLERSLRRVPVRVSMRTRNKNPKSNYEKMSSESSTSSEGEEDDDDEETHTRATNKDGNKTKIDTKGKSKSTKKLKTNDDSIKSGKAKPTRSTNSKESVSANKGETKRTAKDSSSGSEEEDNADVRGSRTSTSRSKRPQKTETHSTEENDDESGSESPSEPRRVLRERRSLFSFAEHDVMSDSEEEVLAATKASLELAALSPAPPVTEKPTAKEDSIIEAGSDKSGKGVDTNQIQQSKPLAISASKTKKRNEKVAAKTVKSDKDSVDAKESSISTEEKTAPKRAKKTPIKSKSGSEEQLSKTSAEEKEAILLEMSKTLKNSSSSVIKSIKTSSPASNMSSKMVTDANRLGSVKAIAALAQRSNSNDKIISHKAISSAASVICKPQSGFSGVMCQPKYTAPTTPMSKGITITPVPVSSATMSLRGPQMITGISPAVSMPTMTSSVVMSVATSASMVSASSQMPPTGPIPISVSMPTHMNIPVNMPIVSGPLPMPQVSSAQSSEGSFLMPVGAPTFAPIGPGQTVMKKETITSVGSMPNPMASAGPSVMFNMNPVLVNNNRTFFLSSGNTVQAMSSTSQQMVSGLPMPSLVSLRLPEKPGVQQPILTTSTPVFVPIALGNPGLMQGQLQPQMQAVSNMAITASMANAGAPGAIKGTRHQLLLTSKQPGSQTSSAAQFILSVGEDGSQVLTAAPFTQIVPGPDGTAIVSVVQPAQQQVHSMKQGSAPMALSGGQQMAASSSRPATPTRPLTPSLAPKLTPHQMISAAPGTSSIQGPSGMPSSASSSDGAAVLQHNQSLLPSTITGLPTSIAGLPATVTGLSGAMTGPSPFIGGFPGIPTSNLLGGAAIIARISNASTSNTATSITTSVTSVSSAPVSVTSSENMANVSSVTPAINVSSTSVSKAAASIVSAPPKGQANSSPKTFFSKTASSTSSSKLTTSSTPTSSRPVYVPKTTVALSPYTPSPGKMANNSTRTASSSTTVTSTPRLPSTAAALAAVAPPTQRAVPKPGSNKKTLPTSPPSSSVSTSSNIKNTPVNLKTSSALTVTAVKSAPVSKQNSARAVNSSADSSTSATTMGTTKVTPAVINHPTSSSMTSNTRMLEINSKHSTETPSAPSSRSVILQGQSKVSTFASKTMPFPSNHPAYPTKAVAGLNTSSPSLLKSPPSSESEQKSSGAEVELASTHRTLFMLSTAFQGNAKNKREIVAKKPTVSGTDSPPLQKRRLEKPPVSAISGLESLAEVATSLAEKTADDKSSERRGPEHSLWANPAQILGRETIKIPGLPMTANVGPSTPTKNELARMKSGAVLAESDPGKALKNASGSKEPLVGGPQTSSKADAMRQRVQQWINDGPSGNVNHKAKCAVLNGGNKCNCTPQDDVSNLKSLADLCVNMERISSPPKDEQKSVIKHADVRAQRVKSKEEIKVPGPKPDHSKTQQPPISHSKESKKVEAAKDKSEPGKTSAPMNSHQMKMTWQTAFGVKSPAKSAPAKEKGPAVPVAKAPTAGERWNTTKNASCRPGSHSNVDKPATKTRDAGTITQLPEGKDSTHLSSEDKKSLQRRPVLYKTTERKESKSGINAFSADNESSVYAFEAESDAPVVSKPFRRRSKTLSRSDEEDTGSVSSVTTSIAVQVNMDDVFSPLTTASAVMPPKVVSAKQIETNDSEVSSQTSFDEDLVPDSRNLYYIPLKSQADGMREGDSIQGVAVKLNTEGPSGQQRVVMSAKLVTKPPVFKRPASGATDPSDEPTASKRSAQSRLDSLSAPPVGTVSPYSTRISSENDAGPSGLNSNTDCVSKKKDSPTKSANTDTSTSEKTKHVKTLKKIENNSTPPPSGVSTSAGSTSTPNAGGSPGKSSSEAGESSIAERSLSPTVDSKTSKMKSRTLRRNSIDSNSSEKSKAPRRTSKSKQNAPSISSSSSVPSTSGTSRSEKKTSKISESGPVPGHVSEAPVFYPSEKEFSNPFEYIEKIRPIGEKFGLCRIVPPPSFKPDCCVEDDMRFTADNQYVHKMLDRWGPNAKEMRAIKKYVATQNIELKQVPLVGGMELDLPRLFTTVQNCGGLMEVMEKKRWVKVADAMRIPKSAQDRATKLDQIYCQYVLPYDTLQTAERDNLFEMVEVEWDMRKERRNKCLTNTSSVSSEEDEEDDDDEDEDDDDECVTKGRSMPLNGFYRVARNTMSMWFRSAEPSPTEVEAEFWRHVKDRNFHICVHSGSIDCGNTNYGFPIRNSQFAKHPWNLKVLSNSSESVLRSLGPVMGLNVPTLHVGMVFSTFCWYRDPHGLPWIEYLHSGASKIWYGIPEHASEKFKEAMQDVAPHYVRNKKVWLASDTAMVPPNLLTERQVALSRTVQAPGQFIVVFPRAYTSSICTGYLVSESVYFAPHVWLDTALDLFKDMQASCESPLFSFDQLLINIAEDSRAPEPVLSQIIQNLMDVIENEVSARNKLKELGVEFDERSSKSKKSKKASVDDEATECDFCRTNLFLSHVKNTQDDSMYCLLHSLEFIKEDKMQVSNCKVYSQYSQKELPEMLQKLLDRIEAKSQIETKSSKQVGSKSRGSGSTAKN